MLLPEQERARQALGKTIDGRVRVAPFLEKQMAMGR